MLIFISNSGLTKPIRPVCRQAGLPPGNEAKQNLLGLADTPEKAEKLQLNANSYNLTRFLEALYIRLFTRLIEK